MSGQAIQCFDIYLVGVGGQGVLTIGEILSEAALEQGIPANFFPTKGMAQRGGFVKAQLRLGREETGGNIPERGADLVIAMERSEALKAIRFLKPGGDFLLWGFVWAPTSVMLGQALYPTLEQVREQVHMAEGRLHELSPHDLPKDLSDNIFVLGVALGSTHLGELLDPQVVRAKIEERWPKAAPNNALAFAKGLESIR
jgi:indolepyruvate ferredoxin oxidoreductase beta subunit